MFSKRKISVICLAISIALFAEGCKKKVPAPPPPPPPAPVATPRAAAGPQCARRGTVHRGAYHYSERTIRHATLAGQWPDEQRFHQPGHRNSASTGSRQVTPTSSTTYTLTATGPGGTVNRLGHGVGR